MTQTERGFSSEKKERVAANNSYRRYQKLGGSIKENDYRKALAQAEKTTSLTETLVAQAKLIAGVVGVPLDNSEDHLDKITILYGALRADSNLGICDQILFAEALRILGRPDLLKKVIKAHPNISFV